MSKVTRANFDPDEFLVAKAAPTRAQAQLLIYDRDGNLIDDEEQAAAISKNGRTFIRCSSGGTTAGAPYDPATLPDVSFTKTNRSTGRLYYELRPVNTPVFDLYVNYLQSRNPAYLHNVARSV